MLRDLGTMVGTLWSSPDARDQAFTELERSFQECLDNPEKGGAALFKLTFSVLGGEEVAARSMVEWTKRAGSAGRLLGHLDDVNLGDASRLGTMTDTVSAPTRIVDPQLDNNILSHLANPNHPNHAAAVAYANANKAAGLSVNRQAYREFLQNFSKDQFTALKEQYGIKLIREISLQELDVVGKRLEQAFAGTDRAISAADARVAASAVLRGEKLATHDLQFFKRAKDLGLNVEFVGSGNAATNAANYVPRPVSY